MYVDFNKKSLSQGHTKIIHAFHFAIEFRLQWSQILRSSGVLRILIIYYSSIFLFLSYTISHPKFGGDTVQDSGYEHCVGSKWCSGAWSNPLN